MMSLGDLANLGQIIGAIAVVVSLVYVALQIRQNTNAVRAATSQSVHEHFANWYNSLACDASLSKIVIDGLRNYGSLSENDKVRFVATFMAFLSYSQNAFIKWKQGLLAPALWLAWEQIIMDTYSTTQFPGMGGKLFEGLTLRLFDPKTRRWSLYWIASNTGTIDPPVVGSFDQNDVGHFFGKDTLNGKPILVVYRWDARNKERPVWGQAFSPDNGKTWEWNFFNVSERPKE